MKTISRETFLRLLRAWRAESGMVGCSIPHKVPRAAFNDPAITLRAIRHDVPRESKYFSAKKIGSVFPASFVDLVSKELGRDVCGWRE